MILTLSIDDGRVTFEKVRVGNIIFVYQTVLAPEFVTQYKNALAGSFVSMVTAFVNFTPTTSNCAPYWKLTKISPIPAGENSLMFTSGRTNGHWVYHL